MTLVEVVGKLTHAGFYANPDCRRGIALFLAERAIASFPCWWITKTGHCACPKRDACPSPGKHPLHVGWQEESTLDPATIDGWFERYPAMNVGVDLEKSRLFVIDRDNRPDGDGIDTIAALEAKLGRPLPRTWTVRTGSDGRHHYLWVPEGEYPTLVKNLELLGLGPHVDIKAKGGLVIAPGGWNKAGQYTFLGALDGVDPLDPSESDDDRTGPAVCPDDLAALLTKPTVVTAPGDAGPVHTTVLAHLAHRMGLIRGPITPNECLLILCPYSRDAGFPGGHDAGNDTSTTLFGAQPGSRIGGINCMHTKCASPTPLWERWLTDVATNRERFPDGERWLAEIDATLDAAGVEPLSRDARAEQFRNTRDDPNPDNLHKPHGRADGGAEGHAHDSRPWWARAQTAREFLAEVDPEITWLEARLLTPGSLTWWASPRGLGKTQVAYAIAVKLARAGHRVLLLDRDNPRKEIKRRLRAWGADDLDTLTVLTRKDVPSLTDPAAWRRFPSTDYDLVILDSWDAMAEGVGEQDSAKPSRALAVVLDIAHGRDGPAVLVLGNTIKTGAHGRGSGVLEDRTEITYEVRDATDFTPSGRKPWVEELPDAGRAAWAARAGRRKRRDHYRLAFIPSKFRVGEEPEPFVFELDLSSEPWQLREVTADLDAAAQAAEEAARQARDARDAAGVACLKAEIARRETAADEPLVVTKAVALLQALEFTRKAARTLVHAGVGKHWRLEPVKGKGNPIALLPVGQPTGNSTDPPPPSPPPGKREGGANGANQETTAAEGFQGGLFTPPAPGADGANPSPKSPRAARASDGGDLRRAGDPSPAPGDGARPVGQGQRCPKCGSTDWIPATADGPGQCAHCGSVVGLDGGPDLTADERRRLDQEAAAGDPLARQILGLPTTPGRVPRAKE
jgi:hypothetical protein